jgi:hypothetical protein
LKSYDEDL